MVASFTRRQVISKGAGSAAAVFFASIFPASISLATVLKDKKYFAFASGPSDIYEKYLTKDQLLLPVESLLLFSTEDGNFFKIKLPFFPHAVIQNPENAHYCVVTSKWGTQLANVNVRTKNISHIYEARPQHRFLGHGTFTPDKKYFLVTEMNDTNKAAVLTVRDWKNDFKIVREISTGGYSAHDCLFLGDNKTIVTANLGNQQFVGSPRPTDYRGFVSYIDYGSGQILKKVYCGNAAAGPAHLRLTNDGTLLCSGAPYKKNEANIGLAGKLLSNGTFQSFPVPDSESGKFKGEALSMAVLDDLVAVTVVGTNSIWIWNYQEMSFQTVLTFQSKPRGVSLSADRQFLVAGEDKDGCFKVKPKTYQVTRSNPKLQLVGSGSHIDGVSL